MNATVRESGFAYDSEIAEYLATCTATAPTYPMTTIGSSLCKTMIDAVLTGDPTKFDHEIAQIKAWTTDWYDLLSAAQHAACLLDFESAGLLNRHISAVAALAERARPTSTIRSVGKTRSKRTYAAT